MRYALWAGIIVVAGCVDGPTPDESSVTTHLDVDWDPEQGRHILGSSVDPRLDGDHHFRVLPTPLDLAHQKMILAVTAAADGANLLATSSTESYARADPRFVGTVLQGVSGGQVKIVSAAQRGTSSSTTYKLQYRATISDSWIDYCGDPAMGTIALKGWYDGRRIHHDDNTITFACDDGVAAKCNDWGYVAGNSGPSADAVTSPDDWDYHQACTAMANADYTRRGESFTRELTPIMIRDYKAGAWPPPDGGTFGGTVVPPLQHPDRFPGDPDAYYVEAAWRPGDLLPVCLSKVRWASLPLDPSGSSLPDPRMDPLARPCEELSFEELRQQGALIVNASKMMDASLHRWRRYNLQSETIDLVTTIRGFYVPRPDGLGPDLQRSTLPFDALAADLVEYLGPAGMILRNLPGTLTQDSVIALYTWKSGNDLVVASEAVAATLGFTRVGFDGFVFRDPSQAENQDLQPVGVCTLDSGNHDLVVAPGATSSCAPSGYAMPLPPP